MSAPQELGDWAAHGVANDDCLFDVESVEDCNGIIGAIGQAKWFSVAEPPSVSVVIERQDRVALAQHLVTGEPIEIGGGGPAMQQQNCWRVGWSDDVADEGRASAR